MRGALKQHAFALFNAVASTLAVAVYPESLFSIIAFPFYPWAEPFMPYALVVPFCFGWLVGFWAYEFVFGGVPTKVVE